MISSIRCRVVIDTNVFISAVVFGGNPAKILELVRKRQIELFISRDISAEIIIKIKNFPVAQDLFSNLKFILEYGSTKIESKKQVAICRDHKDNMLLSLAQAGKADFLITGDKDLLVIKKFHDTKIVTPKEFLAGL